MLVLTLVMPIRHLCIWAALRKRMPTPSCDATQIRFCNLIRHDRLTCATLVTVQPLDLSPPLVGAKWNLQLVPAAQDL